MQVHTKSGDLLYICVYDQFLYQTASDVGKSRGLGTCLLKEHSSNRYYTQEQQTCTVTLLKSIPTSTTCISSFSGLPKCEFYTCKQWLKSTTQPLTYSIIFYKVYVCNLAYPLRWATWGISVEAHPKLTSKAHPKVRPASGQTNGFRGLPYPVS